MNRTQVLKNASGLSYDALADVLNQMGIEITRPALAGRARATSDKFFDNAEQKKFAQALLDPSSDQVRELRDNLVNSLEKLDGIMQWYMAIRDDPDALKRAKKGKKKKKKGKGKKQKALPDAFTKAPKKSKKNKKDKSKPSKNSKQKKSKKNKKDKKSKTKKDKKSKKSKKKLTLLQQLLGVPKSGEKEREPATIKSDPNDPWSKVGDLRDVTEATPPDADDFGTGDMAYDPDFDDFDAFDELNIDDL